MKILITGHKGFVGKYFLRKYAEHDIVGIDLKDGNDCRNFFKQNPNANFDLVIHLAAIVGGRMTIEGNPLAVADDFLSLIAIGIFYSGKLNLATSASTIIAAIIGALLPRKDLVIKYLTPWSFYVVTPVVVISHFPTHFEFNSTVSSFVVARVIGKLVGIALVGWLVLRKEMIGVGLLCGMGMTVSLIINEIATTGPERESIDGAIYLATVISGVLGFTWIRWRNKLPV